MEKDNIFLEDVDVPKIVQRKAEAAFLTIQTERAANMEDMVKNRQSTKRSAKTRRGMTRALVAAAACAAVVAVSGTLADAINVIFGHSDAEHADLAASGAEETILEAVDKMFTLQVKAAESKNGQSIPLTEGNPVPMLMDADRADSWVFGSNEGDIVGYCINIPMIACVGDHIESITYSINHGAFQIVQPENQESIIVDGQLYDGSLNTGSIGGDYDEERDGQPSRPFETLLYKSITLNYDKQSDEYTWINICNERPDSKEIIELLWGDGKTKEEYNGGIQKMLDDTIITCTVNYTDKTSQSANIKIDSRVMTRREAGEQLDPEMDPAELEEEVSVITFELQQEDNG